jgi:hypothetical protein
VPEKKEFLFFVHLYAASVNPLKKKKNPKLTEREIVYFYGDPWENGEGEDLFDIR